MFSDSTGKAVPAFFKVFNQIRGTQVPRLLTATVNQVISGDICALSIIDQYAAAFYGFHTGDFLPAYSGY